MKKWITKRNIITIVLWGLFLLLLILSFFNISHLSSLYSDVSLRYTTPITSDAAADLRKNISKNEEENSMWPTFWMQKNVEFSNDIAASNANCTFFDGEASTLWENTFISGSFPSAFDTKGCAISSELAWTLWGSTDVVGQTIKIGDTEYSVTGVFTEKDKQAFISTGGEPFKDGWTAITLTGANPKNGRANAETFIQTYGLTDPTTIVDGYEVISLAKILFVLPLAVTVIYALFRLYKINKNAKRWQKDLFLFGILLVFALLLPWLLNQLPPWLIPNQWSDFSFWGNVGKQTSAHIKEWLGLFGTPKDILAKIMILKQTIFLFGFALLLPILVRRSIHT